MAQHYLTQVFGVKNIATHTQTHAQRELTLESLPPASVLCGWQIEQITGNIDLFVNFISFQEMEPEVVKNYLKHIMRLGTRWILLRNLREGHRKQQGDEQAGVMVPIRGDDYLAMLPGYELVDRQTHPFGFQTIDGFHSELMLLRKMSG